MIALVVTLRGPGTKSDPEPLLVRVPQRRGARGSGFLAHGVRDRLGAAVRGEAAVDRGLQGVHTDRAGPVCTARRPATSSPSAIAAVARPSRPTAPARVPTTDSKASSTSGHTKQPPK